MSSKGDFFFCAVKRERLEEGIKQVKAKLDKFIKLAKAKFMGLEL